MPDKDLTRFTGLNELGVTSWIAYDWFKFQLARTPPSVPTLECNCKFRFCSCEIPSCSRSIWLIAKYRDWIYKEEIPAEDLVKRDINSLFENITQTFKYLTINDII